METINFYFVDSNYVRYLQNAEASVRGRSRVPNMDYGEACKPKFTCGVVLRINDLNYYVPVTSYKRQQRDNFLIYASNGAVTSSLRFNYMFPVPDGLVTEFRISRLTDPRYKALVAQELRYCIRNEAVIRRLAERTYRRVQLGKDPGLVENSCDFSLLEGKCLAYSQLPNYEAPTLRL